MIWKPTGSPSDSPHGTEMAGTPGQARGQRAQVGGVHGDRVVDAGAEREGDGRRGGADQHVDARSSVVPNAAAKSRLISVRTFCAWP